MHISTVYGCNVQSMAEQFREFPHKFYLLSFYF